jgi:hypothetical protein
MPRFKPCALLFRPQMISILADFETRNITRGILLHTSHAAVGCPIEQSSERLKANVRSLRENRLSVAQYTSMLLSEF